MKSAGTLSLIIIAIHVLATTIIQTGATTIVGAIAGEALPLSIEETLAGTIHGREWPASPGGAGPLRTNLSARYLSGRAETIDGPRTAAQGLWQAQATGHPDAIGPPDPLARLTGVQAFRSIGNCVALESGTGENSGLKARWRPAALGQLRTVPLAC
jgi:hypothetical protein